ncbi:MAG: S-layer homology domain-containing protein [Leucobacter sp.]
MISMSKTGARGRALALGAIAALALSALTAVPAGAVETSGETAQAGEETVAPPVADDSGAETGVADPESRAIEAASGEATDAQAPDGEDSEPAPSDAGLDGDAALTAEAAVPTDRAMSGTVTFPAGMSIAQKRAFSVYINEVGVSGKRYTYGTSGFTYDPTSANSATWSVSGLKRTKYYIWIDVRIPDTYSSSPIFMGPENPTTGYADPIDLSNASYTAPSASMNIGSVSVTVSSLMEDKGRYKLALVNQQTGAVTDVTKSIFSGWTEDNVNHGRHDFNGAPGTYKLRAQLTNNGVTVYYDGTIFGTRDASKAETFTIGLLQRIQLDNFDLREFVDVPKGYKFEQDIDWMARSGVTTGVQQKNGTVKFLPKDNVSREAMAAFLYRLADPNGYEAPAKSPFTDVKPGHKFYTQIMWAYENGVTTGTKQPDGSRKFGPGDKITREAMAAFLYRQYRDEVSGGTAQSTFVDVPKNYKFAEEIKWMAANGITTGVKQANGNVAFAPKGKTTREATAAFLHRAETK